VPDAEPGAYLLPMFEELSRPAPAPTAAASPGATGITALIGEEIHAKPDVRYQKLGCKTILNRCNTPRMPDCWTVNPYRGCAFGCTYCYARYTHEYLGLEGWEAFERTIFVKENAREALRAQVDPARLRARPIAIGTATDPYQPAEKRFRVTRGILEILAETPGLRMGIITKSPLIARDIDLLQRIHAHSRLTVTVSLMTTDPDLARRLDTRAPTPEARLRAVAALRGAGLRAGLNAMPILPGLNDGAEALDALFRRASDAGALYVNAGVLFLPKASRARFLPFLRREFPDLAARYRRFYDGSLDAPDDYAGRLERLLDCLREKHGLGRRRDVSDWAPDPEPQMALPLI
jgi:DNA repair photolyase